MKSWFLKRLPLAPFIQKHVLTYQLPANLNWFYVLGFLLLFLLFNQLLSGFFLTMFYTPSSALAFESIQTLMRDVNFGWLIRYLHTTGASFFFLLMYLHVFKSLLYGSYQAPRELVWLFGMGLFILLLMEGFFGYVLPWGQMSYWAAEVITSWVGEPLMLWIRGDYVVSDPTLKRFFALHVIGLPILIGGLVWLHLVALRTVGSNNPKGVPIQETKPFHPYYTAKDFFALMVFLTLFSAVLFFAPEMGGLFIEPLNSMPADPFSTPEEIHAAWYLAPFYAMLRAVPNKAGGLFAVLSAVLLFCFLPWLDRSPVRTMREKGHVAEVALLLLVIAFITLTVLGLIPLTPVRLGLARFCLVLYFGYFLLMPLYTRPNRQAA